MRSANVYMDNKLAGRLWQDEDGYHFRYSESYRQGDNAQPISVTMPLTELNYESTTLFPFFDGLIPEGWLLDISATAWKLNPRDRMGLLLACCKDCIGAVSIHPSEETEDE